jgi:hypothetical protein
MWELKDKTTNLLSFPMKLIKSNRIEKPREARKHNTKNDNWEDKIDDKQYLWKLRSKDGRSREIEN